MKAIWTPTKQQVDNARISAFALKAEQVAGRSLATYDELYRWSIEQPSDFWGLMFDSVPVIAQKRGSAVLADGDLMPGAKWFPQARLRSIVRSSSLTKI